MVNAVSDLVSGNLSILWVSPLLVAAVLAGLGGLVYAIGRLAGLSALSFWRSVGVGGCALVLGVFVRLVA
jgi:hypothetical protein